MIRGFGSNKTENAILNVTKTARIIHDVADNFERMLGKKKKQTTHKNGL